MDDDSSEPLTPVIVRRKPGDIKNRLIKVYKEAYINYPEYAYTSYRKIANYLNWLERKRPAGFLVAATPQDEVVGFAVEDPNWHVTREERIGEVIELVISPAAKGKGLGERFLKMMIAILQRYRCEKISLEVGVNNVEAQNLYYKSGFKPYKKEGLWLLMFRDNKTAGDILPKQGPQMLLSSS